MSIIRCHCYFLSAMIIGGVVAIVGFHFANGVSFDIAIRVLVPLVLFATIILLSRFAARTILKKIENDKILLTNSQSSSTATIQKKLQGASKSIYALGAKFTRLIEEQQQKASTTTTIASKAIESAAAISGAIEEMNSSISEIERQAEESTRIAKTAGEKAAGADQSVTNLSDFSISVGMVL